MTQTVLHEDPVIVPENKEEPDDCIRHKVHTQCQEEAEFATGMCGMVMDWDERNDGPLENGRQECQKCRETERCPVCHRTRWEMWRDASRR